MLVLSLIVGCSLTGDTSGQTGDEGPDPWLAEDDDGDGLLNGDEQDLGTDPSNADSDGDSYADNDEITVGTDPTDATSVIYEGGWPYQPDKDSFEDSNGLHLKVGNTFPRYVMEDQYGQAVDLYDFAGHGKPVVFDLSGMWCYWCNELAKLLEGDSSELSGYGWDDLGQQIADGDFYWVTVLDGDANGELMDSKDMKKWFKEYPNPDVAAVWAPDEDGDGQPEITKYVNPAGYPTLWLMDENMNVIQTDSQGDYTTTLQILVDGNWDDYPQ